MDNEDISSVAISIQQNYKKIKNGTSKLSLSTAFLTKLWTLIENNLEGEQVMTSSFHVASSSNRNSELLRDLQFILDFIQNASAIKLITDKKEPDSIADISRLKNLKILELQRVNVKCVCGVQKIRPHLQKLTCSYALQSLSEILEKSGADNSSGYVWAELKEAVFSHNKLEFLDNSLEYVPWLTTLDLSYNCLTDLENFANALVNLKHLNLAFNKFEKVPVFSGQICKRLQTLNLKNNFLEDIEGLSTLTNVYELDLGDNCLIEHKTLMSLSHLASLQWLNVTGNPLSFHPNHRNCTSPYLHKNTTTVKFLLDHLPLTNNEKKLAGLLHPSLQHFATQNVQEVNSTVQTNGASNTNKIRRIRNVTIQEEDGSEVVEIVKKKEDDSMTPELPINCAHLETKKQIEQLREQYGSSWLNQQSGMLVQDVLGFDKSLNIPVSSTPYGSLLGASMGYITASSDISLLSKETESKDDSNEKENTTKEVFVTANDGEEQSSSELLHQSPQISDDEDLNEGEESIYLCDTAETEEPIMLVLTETHISERECTTSKQRARWHINTLINCEIKEKLNVHLFFDTVRRDRKERIYTLEESEAQRLHAILQEKLKTVNEQTGQPVMYNCMKCSMQFARNKNVRIDQPVHCPTCDSNLIIQ